jgi:hypothetical protein
VSQIFDDILATETLKNSREKFLNRDISLASSFSGTNYPASPYVGQQCFRTDFGKLFVCKAITPSQIWEEIGSGSRFGIATGTANALVVDFTPDVTLVDGISILVRALYANTNTTPTIALDGNSPKSIVKKGGSPLEVGDIAASGYILQLSYDLINNRWELLNPAISSSTVSFTTYKYLATEGQVTFTGSDFNGSVLSYTLGLIQVFLNGILLDKTDYTATTGVSIVLNSGCTVLDEVVIQSFKKFDIADTYTKAEVDGKITEFPTVIHTWTKTQSGAQVSLTSSSNHIATDASLGNNFIHNITEDTTLDNPSNVIAGTDYKWTFIQHASSAKTLALGSNFKTADGKAFVGISTTVGAINTLVGYAETATSIIVSMIKKGIA